MILYGNTHQFGIDEGVEPGKFLVVPASGGLPLARFGLLVTAEIFIEALETAPKRQGDIA